jgi:hypothetical protein
MFRAIILIATLLTPLAHAGEQTTCETGLVTWKYAQPVNGTLLCTNARKHCQTVAQGAKCQISLSKQEWDKWTGTLDETASTTLNDALLRIGDDFSFTRDGRTVQGVIRIERSRVPQTP